MQFSESQCWVSLYRVDIAASRGRGHFFGQESFSNKSGDLENVRVKTTFKGRDRTEQNPKNPMKIPEKSQYNLLIQ
jgi:hypothetical protein